MLSRSPLPALLLGLSLAAGSGSAAQGGSHPKGTCAVCGMGVEAFPDWAAVVTFRDGSESWFDGPKDLFRFLGDLKHYAPRRRAADIQGIRVKDYYTLKHVDARTAYFVLGSDVTGPMGRELVPFGAEDAAREFLKDHRGQKVLRFPQITSPTLAALD